MIESGEIAMKKLLLLSLIPLFSLSACNSKPLYDELALNHPKKTFNNKNQQLNEKYIQSLRDFTVDFMENSTTKEEKWVFSPLSIATCLSMLNEGARGITREEIDKTLHYNNEFTPKEEIKKMLLNIAIDKPSNGTYLDVNQSVWLHGEDENIVKEYIETLNDYYFAEVIRADLTSKDTLPILADWINRKTKNFLDMKPKDLENFISANPVCWLLNTVYLKSKWKEPFDKKNNVDGNFTTYDGKTITATYMTRKDENNRLPYYECDDYLISSLKFNENINIQILLPKQGKDYNSILKESNNIKTLLNYDSLKKESNIISYKIPKFDIKVDTDLKGTLQKMGCSSMFENTANLNGIDKREGYAYISEAMHKARIKLDNQGVEAAAYTGFDAQGKSAPAKCIDFHVTRPFMYSITDQNGLPLFMGVMNSI